MQNSIAIRKINAEYLISGDHPEPMALRDRLDGVLRRRVSSSLAAAMSGGTADGMLFVRSIDIDVTLNAEWDEGRIADVWADAIAISLAGVVRSRSRDDKCAWFDTRAEYLADYLRQAAAGTASNRWYFSPFEGLRLLPASAAIRTAIGRDPVEGLAALHAMEQADLFATFRTMTRADSLRSMSALFAGGASYSDALARTIALAWLRLPALHAVTAEDEPCQSLILCIEASRGQPRFNGQPLVEAARGLVRLGRILETEGHIPTAPLRNALEAGDVSALYFAAGAGDADLIVPLLQWPRDLRHELAATIGDRASVDRSASNGDAPQGARRGSDAFGSSDGQVENSVPGRKQSASNASGRQGESAPDTSAVDEFEHDDSRSDSKVQPKPLSSDFPGEQTETSFGGIFLLLPILDEILPASAVLAWPGSDSISTASMLRLLILARCFGSERTLRAMRDPLVRTLAGAADIDPNDAADWIAGITKSRWRNLAHDISDRILPLPRPVAPTLLLGSIRSRGGRTAIAIETSRGRWLFTSAYQAMRPERIVERLRRTAIEFEFYAVVVQDEQLAAALQHANPGCAVHWIDDAEVPGIAEKDDGLKEQIARLDRLSGDYEYLASSAMRQIAPEGDSALRTAAQNVLRVFSSRLPGFAHSSLPYLHHNFLSFGASVELQSSGRCVVRTSRPPLHLILQITGMNRSTYNLSWMDDRLFALFPEA